MYENVKCPTCLGPMTSRKNQATGQRFWGCNAYPRCRGTRNTDGEVSYGVRAVENSAPDPDSDLPSDRQRANDRRRF